MQYLPTAVIIISPFPAALELMKVEASVDINTAAQVKVLDIVSGSRTRVAEYVPDPSESCTGVISAPELGVHVTTAMTAVLTERSSEKVHSSATLVPA